MKKDFRIGEATVRPHARTIEVRGGMARVDFKAMQVLLCLVENAGREVTKQEIFDRVWRATAVTADVLTVSIHTLRRALGDDARSPRYIETIPRVGYRLIASVKTPDSRRTVSGSLLLHFPGKVAAFLALSVGALWFSTYVAGTHSGGKKPAVAAAAPKRPVLREEIDPAAYEAYVRGSYLIDRAGVEALKRALPELREAIEIEPELAEAHAALALSYILLWDRGGLDPHEAARRADAALRRALRIKPLLARAHAVQGILRLTYHWDFAGAQKDLQQALRLDPNDALALRWYIRFLVSQGRFDEALIQVRRWAGIEPETYRMDYGPYIFNLSRQHDRALSRIGEQLEVAPRSADLHFQRALTLLWLGHREEAVAAYRQSLEAGGVPAVEMARFDRAVRAEGFEGVLRYVLTRLEEADLQGGQASALRRAEAFSLLGDRPAALEWLERALADREHDLLTLAYEPEYDHLRGDPRFQAILRRIGLPAS